MTYTGDNTELIREHARKIGAKIGQVGWHAYAGTPGRGPQGETCKTCRYCCYNKPNKKRFYKCGHEAAAPSTSGAATDIRVGTPACEHWEASE